MSSDRYHKAAKDGYLEALKEATRKDLNTKDEDGMTPTLWSAYEGNLDALRLIVGRGGDPDKNDNWGNTALHFTAARGHLNCVTFLVNFEVNMWAMDIDFHTPKDLAGINNREEILRFLDASMAKAETKDKKKVKVYKEKALKDAEKRAKDFDKLQKKASRALEEEQRRLSEQRKQMERKGGKGNEDSATDQRPKMGFLSLRKDTKLIHGQSPKFSEIVTNSQQTGTGKSRGTASGVSAVYKKVQQRKTKNSATGTGSDFKVAEIESGGKRSVRSLSGLQRDSQVMYVPKYDVGGVAGRRGKISGLFDNEDDIEEEENEDDGEKTVIPRSLSQPNYLHHVGTDSGFNDDNALPHNTVSIFERPGFGSVAFRNTMSSTMSNFPNMNNGQRRSLHLPELTEEQRDSIGSAGSLNRRASNQEGPWDELDVASDEDDESESGPLELFLAAAGLASYIPKFLKERIDLETLVLLKEDDLKQLGIEMGPRRKLLKSIADRQQAMERPGEVIDSRL